MQTVNFSGGSQQESFQPSEGVPAFFPRLPVFRVAMIINKTMWLCGVYNIRGTSLCSFNIFLEDETNTQGAGMENSCISERETHYE